LPLTWWCVGHRKEPVLPPALGGYEEPFESCGWVSTEREATVRDGRYRCPCCGGLANRKNFPPDASPERQAAAVAEIAAEYRKLVEKRGQKRLPLLIGDET
jgi:hypothetical protein